MALIFLIDVKEIMFEESSKNRLFLASICGSIVQLVGYETNLFCGNRQIAPRNGIHKNSLPRIITTEKYYLFTQILFFNLYDTKNMAIIIFFSFLLEHHIVY